MSESFPHLHCDLPCFAPLGIVMWIHLLTLIQVRRTMLQVCFLKQIISWFILTGAMIDFHYIRFHHSLEAYFRFKLHFIMFSYQ